jgi:hypothetical protein
MVGKRGKISILRFVPLFSVGFSVWVMDSGLWVMDYGNGYYLSGF